MSAPPYMKLYIADYLADTTHLSTAEHGAYLLLLMAMWRAGGKLPAVDEKLAKIARFTPEEWACVKAQIMDFFVHDGGSIRHKRLAAELSKYETVVKAKKTASKAGVSAKANKNNKQASPYGSFFDNHMVAKPEPEPERYSDDKESSGRAAQNDPDAEAWNLAMEVLREMQERPRRAFFGKLLATNKLMARDLLPILTSCRVNGTKDPASMVAKTANGMGARRRGNFAVETPDLGFV